jgi:hypothetical protein
MRKVRALFYVCAGLFLLAGAYHLGARSATAQAQGQGQAPPQVVRASSSGRWTIVNGTPELTRNIMLLDTVTGETWVTCSDTTGTRYWCKIIRTNMPTSKSGE